MPRMDIKRLGRLNYQANEAINTLCTNLSFVGGDIKKIMITSCHPQEGKSFVSMNLLRAMAGLGMRVVLVDADVRASAIQGTYGVSVHGVGRGSTWACRGIWPENAAWRIFWPAQTSPTHTSSFPEERCRTPCPCSTRPNWKIC